MTWSEFQTWWQNQYNLKQKTETTTASLGFGGSANSTQSEQNKNVASNTAYKDTVKSFGTAFTANSAAFNKLKEVNQHLGTILAASVTDIQSQIQSLTHMLHNMMAAATQQKPPAYATPRT